MGEVRVTVFLATIMHSTPSFTTNMEEMTASSTGYYTRFKVNIILGYRKSAHYED